MSSVLKSSEKECVTSTGHGGGDGIRQNISARKRVPISSARKFNARTPKDEKIKLKLETALHEMCGTKKIDMKNQMTPNRHNKCFPKAASIAEITPTTTKIKRRSSIGANEESCELYATPRPFDNARRVRFCPLERTKCRIFKRLMLLAWRRSRADLTTSKESLKQQKEQVNQLERQIGVLNQLRASEELRRGETILECQKLKKAIDILEFENTQLSEETQNLQNTVEIIENELKVAKSENNFLSDQSMKMQDIITRKKSENKSLEEKIQLQELEMMSQKEIIQHLEENLKSAEKSLQHTESNYKIKERKYAQLKCEFKKQMEANNSLSKQLESVQEEKSDMSLKVDNLEFQLKEYIESCEILKDLNEELTQEKQDVSMALGEEKKQTWAKSTKQLAVLSLTALQKIAHVMLPAYLDVPVY